MKREAYQEMFAVEDRHWWFVARRRIIAKILDSLVPGNNGAILEIGCGTGGNLSMLATYGSVVGMEMDDEARCLAEGRNICPVRKGVLPEKIPFGREFDLVCLLDVLEHIDDEEAAILAVGRKLKTGGKLLLTVPAFQFLWSAHDVELHHKRRYRQPALISSLQQAGFKVHYVTYFNTFFFPIISSVRLFGRIFGREGGTDVAMPSAHINRMLEGIFAAERFLLPAISLPFGVSLLVLAEKATP